MLYGLYNNRTLILALGLIFLFLVLRDTKAEDVKKWIVMPPAPCYKLDKIDNNNVYFIRDKFCKNPHILPLEVNVNSNVKVLNIYVDGKIWKKQLSSDLSKEDIYNLIEKSEKESKTVDITNKYKDTAYQEAQNAYQLTQTENFQNQVRNYSAQIQDIISEKVQVFSEYFNPYKDFTHVKGVQLSPDERIYIFISSSIPDVTIRNYFKASTRFVNNVYFVMIGGIQGLKWIQPTVNWIYERIKVDPLCEETDCRVLPVRVIIDPFLFKKYKIQRVPTVVYVRGLPDPDSVSGSESQFTNSMAVKSSGDVSINYHIKRMVERTGDNRLKQIVDALGDI